MEVVPLLETLYEEYGYDFRQYSQAHIRRRIANRMTLSGINNISLLQEKITKDKVFADLLIGDLSITVTEMFRDPSFYQILRKEIVPILKTYSFIKVWHAGCATGEEVYSFAILLKEEGLYDRATIYATDFNQRALNQAKEGIFDNEVVKLYTRNYRMAEGKEPFSNYYTSKYNMVIMDQSLKKNIVWGHHNLVTDSVFAEVHLVFCRNVLIYFTQELQNKVHQLFFNSLINGGILCLGSKESLRFNDIEGEYDIVDRKQRIFKKRY